MELDHDEPPDGEGKGEEDGDRVGHHREADVEQHKDSPPKRHLERKNVIKIKNAFLPSLLLGSLYQSSASCA